MKRVLSAFIITMAMLSACSDEVSFTPGISFLTPAPEIIEETATFRIISQSFSSTDTLRIPVTFGGTASFGTDYEVSADHFVIHSESPIDSIIVTTKQFGTKKTVSLSLNIPEGFTGGKYVTSEFLLQDKYGFLTFSSSKGLIADTTSYSISLCDSLGAAKPLSKDASITFEVNKEKSTAVEGVDFMFTDSLSKTITGGNSSLNFRINPIADQPREGHEKIVLSIIADDKFDTGKNPEIELSLLKKELSTIEGRWKIDAITTDSLYLEKIWGSQCTGYSLVPECNFFDEFTISFSDAGFTPTLYSTLKDYFIGWSEISFEKEMDFSDTDGQTNRIQLMSFDKTNRYFSEVETSEDALSFVGFHLKKEAETEADLLDLYIVDHTSRSFMPELEYGNKYGTEKPVATAPGMYLITTFRKM